MTRISIVTALLLTLLSCTPEISESDKIIQNAFENKTSGLQVEGSGTAIRLLADDLDGSRHQKFILRLESQQTLLISHNIDLAPRINTLKLGDTIEFYGVYEWNSQGGLVHWTHYDPNEEHVDGWLKHNGIKYDRY